MKVKYDLSLDSFKVYLIGSVSHALTSFVFLLTPSTGFKEGLTSHDPNHALCAIKNLGSQDPKIVNENQSPIRDFF